MTYRELIQELLALKPDQLDDDATVYIVDEFYAVKRVFVTEEDDVLHAGHPFLALTDNKNSCF